MQFTHIYIKKLFGLYDYDIDLHHEEDDKLTILTGPNGYGKTTILTIINKLNPKELYYFYLLKYEKIEVGLSDGSRISIYQEYVDEKNNEESSDIKLLSEKEVRFEWATPEKGTISFFIYNSQNIKKAERHSLYSYYAISSVENKRYDKELLNNRGFNEFIAHSLGQDIFIMLLEGIRSDFIKANRIYNEVYEESKELPIQRVKKCLKSMLSNANKEFLEQSQRIEKNFINEILSCDNTFVNEEQYKKLANVVSERFNDLIRFRLTDKIEIPTYVESKSFILYAYIKSLNEKIEKFGNLPEKLKLFENLIKSKKFANKNISFSPQHGFLIVSDTGEFLDEGALSSGEQNEIIMLYKLIFEITDNTTLLIDEPENSLHVAWQFVFLDDIKEIAKIKNLQLIISTHSISIVSKGEENAIDLYYLINK